MGRDNMTALRNETAKVKIHYLLHYDLIKLHKIISISLRYRAALCLVFSPLEEHEVGGVIWETLSPIV